MKWFKFTDRSASGLLLIGITLLACMTGALSRIDYMLYDTAQQYAGRDLPSDVVIVNIDEQSLASLGRWPWSRRLHANLIDRLSADGARVIGFDVMFAEPQAQDLLADQFLADSMARAGNIVLPVVIENVRQNGQLIETLPLPQLVAQAAGMGRVHAELDADAIARSLTLWEGIGQPIWPHFGQVMLAVAQQQPDNLPSASPQPSLQPPQTLVKLGQRYINFTTVKQRLPSVSYVQVLRGEFSPGTFRDKLVLVGATASGMADTLPTPVSGFKQPMPGVEFLANALISMRAQTLVILSPLWLSSLLSCVLAFLPMFWMPYLSARASLLANIGFAGVVAIVAMGLPIFFHVWVPLTAGLMGLLSAYPIWTWRKLESASHFLDEELARLHQELATVHVSSSRSENLEVSSSSDPFQHRINQVKAATVQLQLMEQAQRDTLAFISHDIRVPLASAAAQIKTDLGEHHPAHKQLSRALGWTEDFLQTSRAQMLRPQDFAEIDVVGLLHEVTENIYPLVCAQSLHLNADLPVDPIWIQGNFDTLSRAILNLLSNALKFSPAGGCIDLRARAVDHLIHIAVTDQGHGIEPQDMSRLFQRFGRLESTPAVASVGVGLGLYFVQTTVQKHGGTVQVTSSPGQTTFLVVLPCVLS